MVNGVSRRALLSGLLSTVAGAALAEAPLVSLRPAARAPAAPEPPAAPSNRPPRSRQTLEEIIAQADLGGVAGVLLVDARSGEVIESAEADVPVPPASVTKSLTALYALDALGGNFRFVTRLLATGPINDGVLEGDLVLAGGGDPTLSADHLAQLAEDLQNVGVASVKGRFLCWRGALPYAEEIEPSQLDHLGYNPAVSGLNLNYNRVHFVWKREGGQWQVSMDARTEDRIPPVTMSRVRIADRSVPVFVNEGPDRWSVARGALGNGGSRWMPVRQPALYAGDVFRTLAGELGIALPEPQVVDALPNGTEVAQHQSPTLRQVLQEMLLYSTNLTAEVCGLAASQARLRRSVDIETSAAEMTQWLARTYGIEADLKDHSGLSDRNRISAAAKIDVLLQEGPDSPLRPILRRIPMRDDENRRLETYPSVVRAKTGTLNFVSALSGYVRSADGRDLAFTIFTADIQRRERGKATGDEIPAGSVAWNRRARRLQQVLLQRWGLIGREAQGEGQAPAAVGVGGVPLNTFEQGGALATDG